MLAAKEEFFSSSEISCSLAMNADLDHEDLNAGGGMGGWAFL